MISVRGFLAVAALVLGLVLAVPAASKGMIWTPLSFFATGVSLSLAVVFFEESILEGGPLICVLFSMVTTFLGFAGVVESNPAFSRRGTTAQTDFLDMLIRLEIQSDDLSPAESALVRAGRLTCSNQLNADLFTLVTDATKALYFPPALSLADAVITSASSSAPKRCLDYYVELKKLQPDLFVGFDRNHAWLLSPSKS